MFTSVRYTTSSVSFNANITRKIRSERYAAIAGNGDYKHRLRYLRSNVHMFQQFIVINIYDIDIYLSSTFFDVLRTKKKCYYKKFKNSHLCNKLHKVDFFGTSRKLDNES